MCKKIRWVLRCSDMLRVCSIAQAETVCAVPFRRMAPESTLCAPECSVQSTTGPRLLRWLSALLPFWKVGHQHHPANTQKLRISSKKKKERKHVEARHGKQREEGDHTVTNKITQALRSAQDCLLRRLVVLFFNHICAAPSCVITVALLPSLNSIVSMPNYDGVENPTERWNNEKHCQLCSLQEWYDCNQET